MGDSIRAVISLFLLCLAVAGNVAFANGVLFNTFYLKVSEPKKAGNITVKIVVADSQGNPKDIVVTIPIKKDNDGNLPTATKTTDLIFNALELKGLTVAHEDSDILSFSAKGATVDDGTGQKLKLATTKPEYTVLGLQTKPGFSSPQGIDEMGEKAKYEIEMTIKRGTGTFTIHTFFDVFMPIILDDINMGLYDDLKSNLAPEGLDISLLFNSQTNLMYFYYPSDVNYVEISIGTTDIALLSSNSLFSIPEPGTSFLMASGVLAAALALRVGRKRRNERSKQ